MRFSARAGVSISLLMSGCSTHVAQLLPPPPNTPHFSVDIDASVVHAKNITDVIAIREWGAKELDTIVVMAPGPVQSARFKADVTADYASYGYLAPIAVATFIFMSTLWLPLGRLSADVDLVVDIGGETYEGKGHKDVSLYLAGGGEPEKGYWKPCVEGAFHEAFLDALKKRTPKPTAALSPAQVDR